MPTAIVLSLSGVSAPSDIATPNGGASASNDLELGSRRRRVRSHYSRNGDRCQIKLKYADPISYLKSRPRRLNL